MNEILASITTLAANPSTANMRWGLITTRQAMSASPATLAILAVNAYHDDCETIPTLDGLFAAELDGLLEAETDGLLDARRASANPWTADGMTVDEVKIILSHAWTARVGA